MQTEAGAGSRKLPSILLLRQFQIKKMKIKFNYSTKHKLVTGVKGAVILVTLGLKVKLDVTPEFTITHKKGKCISWKVSVPP